MDNALKAWQEKYKPAETTQNEKAQTALDQWKQRYSPANAPQQEWNTDLTFVLLQSNIEHTSSQ